MALDNVTSHFSTMLEPITSASFLSSLYIIHAVTPLAFSFLITVFRTEWFRQSFVCRKDICRRFWWASFLRSLWLVRFELVSTGQTHPRRPTGQIVCLLPENFYVFLPNQKAARRRPFGTGLVRRCPQGLFSPFFTFLRAIFFRPFRLSLAPHYLPLGLRGWAKHG